MADFTSGACDMAMGGISVTLQRQKQAFFSIPIDVNGKTPITKCENVDKFATVEQIDQPGVRVIEPPGRHPRGLRARPHQGGTDHHLPGQHHDLR
ncbi:transporter substrate-binding domain-containing protein [Inquilinus limosus]|uniref:transporter substrate-binding domain-containing protein n=1 Tax=Inquilinus limosus TaxID=171674 RepID=UPI001C5341B0|nr:transporter substrate-binding domain-containing protein [Inquilinus limosus]